MTEKRKKIKCITNYKQLRYRLELSQTEFWNRVGSAQTAGCRYENGRKVPKAVAVLAHLVYVAGMDIDARDYK